MEIEIRQRLQLKQVFDDYRLNPGTKRKLSTEDSTNFLINSNGIRVGFHLKPEQGVSKISEPEDKYSLSVSTINLGGIGGYETFYKSDINNPVPIERERLLVEFYSWLEENSSSTDVICIQDFPTFLRAGKQNPDFIEKIASLGYEIVLVPYVYHETKPSDVDFRAESIGILINRNLLPRMKLKEISLIPHFQNQLHGNQKGDYLDWNPYYNIDPRNKDKLKETNPFWGQTLILTLEDDNGRSFQVGTLYISPASSAIDRRRTLRRSIDIVKEAETPFIICGDTNMYGIKVDTSKPLIEGPFLVRSFPFKIALMTLLGGITKDGISRLNLEEVESFNRLAKRLNTNLLLPPKESLSKGPIKWIIDIGVTNLNVSSNSGNQVKFTDHKAINWKVKY